MSNKSAKETVNSRILLLKKELELGQNEFCNKDQISTATFHSIANGNDNIRPRTIRNICENLGANPEWVFKGEGEKFLSTSEKSETSSITEKLYNTLKDQLDRKEAQIQRLTTIILNLTGGGEKTAANFRKAFNKAGSEGKREAIILDLLEVA